MLPVQRVASNFLARQMATCFLTFTVIPTSFLILLLIYTLIMQIQLLNYGCYDIFLVTNVNIMDCKISLHGDSSILLHGTNCIISGISVHDNGCSGIHMSGGVQVCFIHAFYISQIYIGIQWNLCNMDNLGPFKSILIYQGVLNFQLSLSSKSLF